MSITTAGDLVNYCFRVSGISGVGQTASADDFNDALTTLQAMLAQWQRKRWLVWDLTETTLIATGATSYTVGPAGNFVVTRPDRIESAFVRFVSTSPAVDYPIGIIESREDYNRIAIKTMGSVPQAVFYDAAWPTGTLYFWPVPAIGAYEMHVFTMAVLPTLLLATSLLTFPPEYIEALKYGLVVHLTMDWGLDPRPAHVQALRAALNTIRNANAQIPELRMPGGLPGRSRVGTDRAAFTSGWR